MCHLFFKAVTLHACSKLGAVVTELKGDQQQYKQTQCSVIFEWVPRDLQAHLSFFSLTSIFRIPLLPSCRGTTPQMVTHRYPGAEEMVNSSESPEPQIRPPCSYHRQDSAQEQSQPVNLTSSLSSFNPVVSVLRSPSLSHPAIVYK